MNIELLTLNVEVKREEQEMLGKWNIQQGLCVVFGLLALAGLMFGWFTLDGRI